MEIFHVHSHDMQFYDLPGFFHSLTIAIFPAAGEWINISRLTLHDKITIMRTSSFPDSSVGRATDC